MSLLSLDGTFSMWKAYRRRFSHPSNGTALCGACENAQRTIKQHERGNHYGNQIVLFQSPKIIKFAWFSIRKIPRKFSIDRFWVFHWWRGNGPLRQTEWCSHAEKNSISFSISSQLLLEIPLPKMQTNGKGWRRGSAIMTKGNNHMVFRFSVLPFGSVFFWFWFAVRTATFAMRLAMATNQSNVGFLSLWKFNDLKHNLLDSAVLFVVCSR